MCIKTVWFALEEEGSLMTKLRSGNALMMFSFITQVRLRFLNILVERKWERDNLLQDSLIIFSNVPLPRVHHGADE